MTCNCIRCGSEFDTPRVVGYCERCRTFFASSRDQIRKAQRPAPNVFADGAFRPAKECPHTVQDPTTDRPVCGLCGSDEIEQGYGIGGGYGMGSYNFCQECYAFLDFHEDRDE